MPMAATVCHLAFEGRRVPPFECERACFRGTVVKRFRGGCGDPSGGRPQEFRFFRAAALTSSPRTTKSRHWCDAGLPGLAFQRRLELD